MRIIDAFCHWLTPRYRREALRLSRGRFHMLKRASELKAMTDLETRLKAVESLPEYSQVVSMASPPPEALGTPAECADLCCIANDELAELVLKHPRAFAGFAAALPAEDIGFAVIEAKRALEQLNALGVQLFTNINGRPLDAEKLAPLFDLCSGKKAPVWLHPWRTIHHPDYASECFSKFDTWWAFGWPYETSAAMAHLVFTGVFDRWPDLKIITHHLGGMVPMVAGRIAPGLDRLGLRNSPEEAQAVDSKLKERPILAFKRFYIDTACCGYAPTIECGRSFFGTDRLLFASDMPFGPDDGMAYVRGTLDVVEQAFPSEKERCAVLSGNAEKIMNVNRRS